MLVRGSVGNDRPAADNKFCDAFVCYSSRAPMSGSLRKLDVGLR